MKKVEENTVITVEGVKFITTPRGSIASFIVLYEPIVIVSGEDKITYEVIQVSLEDINKLGINIGQKLDTKITYSSIHDVRFEFNGSMFQLTPASVPSTCKSCGSVLKIIEKDYMCTGHLCPAKARTSIKKLFASYFCYELTDDSFSLFDKYLDNFPTWDSFSEIHNIVDYVKILKSLETVNVLRRSEILDELHLGGEIKSFEILLWEDIRDRYYKNTPYRFWSLFFEDDVATKLSHLTPESDYIASAVVTLNLDPDIETDIISNLDGFKTLFKELTTLR